MAGLYFEDYQVGAVYTTPARTITETDVEIYSGLSGDHNPLHTDEEYCKTTPFGTRIAHGPLAIGIGMGLSGRLGLTEGTTLAFLSIDEWRFLGPIKIGDTIHVKITIAETRPSSKGGRGIVKRQLSIVNQRGETVQEGTATILVASRPSN